MDGFLYAIGSEVIYRRAVAHTLWETRCGQFTLPLVGTVLEQRAVECSGGLQRYYTVALQGGRIESAELELMPAKDFDPCAPGGHFDALLKVAGKLKEGTGDGGSTATMPPTATS